MLALTIGMSLTSCRPGGRGTGNRRWPRRLDCRTALGDDCSGADAFGATENHETRRRIPVRSVPRPLQGVTGGGEKLLVGEHPAQSQIVAPLAFSGGRIRERASFAGSNKDISPRARENSDDVGWESGPSADHVRNPDFAVGIGAQRGIRGCRVGVEDINVVEDREVPGIDPGNLDERLGPPVGAGIDRPGEPGAHCRRAQLR